jgi:hypothetical protein
MKQVCTFGARCGHAAAGLSRVLCCRMPVKQTTLQIAVWEA